MAPVLVALIMGAVVADAFVFVMFDPIWAGAFALLPAVCIVGGVFAQS